jgi:CDGSH-type Zn-finger protein
MSDTAVRVIVKPTGPIHIEGPVTLVDNEGNSITPPPAKISGLIKLCGCGLSANKPFCDSSHKKALEAT